jgi:RNA-directed DNA polymerase
VRVPMRDTGADQPVVVTKSRNGDGAKGLDRSALSAGQPAMGGAGSNKAKPFSISKKAVWEAYKRVKANKGAAGVDGESISDFEKDLKRNLYKIWNRMSSGSWFPPPVRTVVIPKKEEGKQRNLGVPTVSDRIAQMVAKLYLEPELEPYFHSDSYAYRPRKSAREAVGAARERCWKYKWALDLDIKGFFDNLDHSLMLKAVRKHTQCRWIILYIERWLRAPAQQQDGILVHRDKGTPQGSVISPLLSNLFLHYAFDEWMRRNYPEIPFERYADDIVVHCRTEKETRFIRGKIETRLAQCRLELHPEKTHVIYCKTARRQRNYPNVKFDFLGFSFQPRFLRNQKGNLFVGFAPAVSNKAAKKMRDIIRSWRIHLRSDKSLEELSRMFNPTLRGWVNYYGSYGRSVLINALTPLNVILSKWVMRKYKRFRGHQRRAVRWLQMIRKRDPQLFAHWQLAPKPAAGR